jgi:TRAP transporter TAXI family solute receptor
MFTKTKCLKIAGLLFLVTILAVGVCFAQTRIMFATGPATGGWYPTGAAIGDIIMNTCPDLNITVSEGGGVGNIRDVNANRAQLGYTFSNVFAEALGKRDPFQEDDINQVAGFLSLYVSHMQSAVLAKSDIKSYGDLAGKRIAPGRKNWSGEILMQRVLEAYGLSYDSIKSSGGGVSFVGFSDMTMLMRDNHIDLCTGVTAAPSSFLMDLQTTHDIRFIEIDKEHADKIIAKYPGYAYMEMPANIYKNQPNPVKTLAGYTIVVVRKDMDEDVVYRMAKGVMENLDTLYKSHPVISFLTKETALDGFKIEDAHPGVVKYFREIGALKN